MSRTSNADPSAPLRSPAWLFVQLGFSLAGWMFVVAGLSYAF
jgi:hypothetical protein